jgi:ATP synthase protein I
MTDPSPSTEPQAGAPFGAMLRGALLPSTVAGIVAVVGVVLWRGGSDALAGGLIGLVVSVGFFASGMFLLSRLVRSSSPHAFFAVAMAVYLGQVIVLLLVILLFKDAPTVDGVSLGVVALVVTLVWQVFAMRALRRARVPVYDPPTGAGEGR